MEGDITFNIMEGKSIIAFATLGMMSILGSAIGIFILLRPHLKEIATMMYVYRGSLCPHERPKTTEDGTRAMRANVHSIAATSPHAIVVGQVFLTRGIDISEFIKLTQHYQFDANYPEHGVGPSVQFQIPNASVMAEAAVPEFFASSTFETWLIKKNEIMPKNPEYETIQTLNRENTKVISFVLQGPATSFERLWQEQPDTVRAIGMSCTSIFGIRRPSEELWP